MNQERTWTHFLSNQIYSFEKSTIKKKFIQQYWHIFFHRYILHGKFWQILTIPECQQVFFILISVFSFMSQKLHPGDFLRPEVILSRSYIRKYSIWPAPSIIINLSFHQLNRLELQANFFRIFISLWYLSLIIFHFNVRVTCHGWFSIELPNKASFLISSLSYDHCKNVFYSFS